MLSEQTIREAVQRIVTAARPTKVIVFGSHARGEPDEGSDLDLLVIEPQLVDRYEEMVRLRDVIGPIGTGVDVLVYSEEEAERRGQVPGTAVYWALKEGRVVYDATPPPEAGPSEFQLRRYHRVCSDDQDFQEPLPSTRGVGTIMSFNFLTLANSSSLLTVAILAL